MADRKISDLTALTTPATGDLIPIVDISEAAAADKNKSITVGELLRGAPDGTAAAPGFAFESDGGNGMFLGGTDILAFSTGGSQAVTIDASQRLGVGTSSPSSYNADAADLVIGSSGSNGLTIVSGTTNNGNIFFADGTSGDDQLRGFVQYNHQLDFFNIGTNATSAIRIDSSQRVGIGTTSPAEKLDINVSSTLGFSIGDDPANSAQLALRSYQGSTNNNVRSISYIGSDHRFQVGAVTGTTASEAVRIDTDGRLLVGTSSADTGATARYGFVQISGNSGGNTGGYLTLARGAAPTIAGQTLGGIFFTSGADEFGSITCASNGGVGSGDAPGRLVFSTTADGASSPTERMRIGSDGLVTINETARLSVGAYFGTVTNTKRIDDASNGGGTATLYIGNAAIQVSSDVRLKENIEDTKLDALDAINKIKVKDFNWNDPSDTSHNNRNARGKWTGVIAQELVEVLPFVVNAPRKEEDGSIDHDSEDRWTLDQSQLCPVLIKAVQQQQEIIASLEARLSALEAS